MNWTGSRLVAALFAVACNQGSGLGPDIAFVDVSPTDRVIETGPAGGEPVQFEARATYDNGDEGRLDLVEWSLSNQSVGDIDEAGLFTPSTEHGGVTWVTARIDEVEGRATATVVYREQINDEGVDTSLFDRTPLPISGTWVYPEDGVNLPRNTPSITFQWLDLAADAYELRFRSALTDLSVYTTSNTWEADASLWPVIASTNAGGEVQVDLRAAITGSLFEEEPLTLSVNRLDASGSIVYWSTSVQGFLEIPYGEPSRDFLTMDQAGVCVGCHAISSHGQIAFTYDGGDGSNGPLGVKWMDDLSDFVPYGSGHQGNFKTYSPDGRYLLFTLLGDLYLLDAQSGAELGRVYYGGDLTHVDWSPDGGSVVATRTDGHHWDWTYLGPSGIVTLAHLGDGEFGPPEVLYQPEPPYKAYYPAFSPDGEWVAFNMSTGEFYDDLDATLWVIAADGSGPAIRLDAANLVGDVTNSWPRWAPLPDDDVLWLSFASRRRYGFFTDDNPQIWVAAFDPVRARRGKDPSWPAFWLPNQEPWQNNHLPVWAP